MRHTRTHIRHERERHIARRRRQLSEITGHSHGNGHYAKQNPFNCGNRRCMYCGRKRASRLKRRLLIEPLRIQAAIVEMQDLQPVTKCHGFAVYYWGNPSEQPPPGFVKVAERHDLACQRVPGFVAQSVLYKRISSG